MPRSPHHHRSPLLASVLPAIAVLIALSACAPVSPVGTPPPDEPSPTTSVAPVDEPVEPTEPEVDPAVALHSTLSAAISSGDTDALDAVFADPVHVVIASSEANSLLNPVDAVVALDYIQPGVGTWEWQLPESTIAGYRASEYYAEFFPADVIVGRSSAGPVVAFTPDGGTVAAILMAIDEQLLFF